jgi:hypothetical protein
VSHKCQECEKPGIERNLLFGDNRPARRSQAANILKEKQSMTKKILSTLAGLILLLVVAVPLQAGSIPNHEMTVTIPFEFAAGDKVLPAGEYTVQVKPERGTVVLVGPGQKPLMLLTISKESRSAPRRGKLVFQRYGASIFLSEVWSQDNDTGQTLAASAVEKELARKKQPEQTLVVQAR